MNEKEIARESQSSALRLEAMIRKLFDEKQQLQIDLRKDPYPHLDRAIHKIIYTREGKYADAVSLLDDCVVMKGYSMDKLIAEGFDISQIIDRLARLVE